MSVRISTRHLLLSGMAAAILFPVVVVVQALLREGFELATHPLSMLSLGSVGWIQITNFIVTGVLFLGFAVGLRRALGTSRGGTWGPRLFGFYGLVMVAAGIFTVDPMYGFPPGAPEGLPDTLTWHAQIHNFTFIFAFLGLIIAQLVFARRFAATGRWAFAIYCVVTALASPVLIVISQVTPAATGYILFATGLIVNLWIVLLGATVLTDRRLQNQRHQGVASSVSR